MNLDESDALLYELKMMTQITCGFEKVNNLIVDLNLKHILTFPCPLVATELKKKKE